MKQLLKVSLFFLMLVLTGVAMAKPKVNCVSTNQSTGDVVISFTPDVPCSAGNFVNYTIYGATDSLNGPYQIVGTITNANITSYNHTGANGTILHWYYYVVQNCVGSSSANSDTVSGQLLDIPIFSYVTVINGQIQINWTPSVSPAVNRYVILYINPTTGLSISIDTVPNTVHSIIDPVNQPGNGYVVYTIKALDACNTPTIEEPLHHNSIFLDVLNNACKQESTIGWNRYSNWQGDTTRAYVLESVIDGGAPTYTSLGQPFQAGAPLSARESYNFNIKGLVGNNICYRIIAIDPNGIDSSYSNQVCIPLSVLRSTAYNYGSNATVVDSHACSFSWLIDTTAQVQSFVLYRSSDGTSFTKVDSLGAGNNKTFELTLVDSSAIAASGSYYYHEISLDSCGYQVTSSTGRTIFLTAISASAGVNSLSWNAFELTGATILNYTIYRIKSDGTIVPLTTVLPNVLSFDDSVGNAVSDNGTFCYRIVSNYVLNINSLSISKSYITTSNDACVVKDPVIYIPTAFVPSGINKFFKPVLLFGVSQYDFRIFDRWGKQVYVTQDYVAGWDGTYNGEKMPLGGYVYQLKVVSASGQTFERQGVVALIR